MNAVMLGAAAKGSSRASSFYALTDSSQASCWSGLVARFYRYQIKSDRKSQLFSLISSGPGKMPAPAGVTEYRHSDGSLRRDAREESVLQTLRGFPFEEALRVTD
jgi:hypothetical protein